MSLIEWPLIKYLLTSVHPGLFVFFLKWWVFVKRCKPKHFTS